MWRDNVSQLSVTTVQTEVEVHREKTLLQGKSLRREKCIDRRTGREWQNQLKFVTVTEPAAVAAKQKGAH